MVNNLFSLVQNIISISYSFFLEIWTVLYCLKKYEAGKLWNKTDLNGKQGNNGNSLGSK